MHWNLLAFLGGMTSVAYGISCIFQGSVRPFWLFSWRRPIYRDQNPDAFRKQVVIHIVFGVLYFLVVSRYLVR